MSGHGEWSHDMYEGPTYGRRAVVAAVPQAAPMATRRRAGPTKVRIMNLGHDILEPELEQLFKKFNATKWSVRYDKSGRSTGIAYVEFSTFSDANR